MAPGAVTLWLRVCFNNNNNKSMCKKLWQTLKSIFRKKNLPGLKRKVYRKYAIILFWLPTYLRTYVLVIIALRTQLCVSNKCRPGYNAGAGSRT